MACGDGGSASAEWREPTSSDQLPIHRSESPTGYSSAGCSPAEPASASPVTDIVAQIQSSEPIKLRCSTSLRDAGKLALLVPLPSARGCHLYFARRVSFLSCTDNRFRDAAPTYYISKTPGSVPRANPVGILV
jgi:hypothetical protein